MVMQKRPRFYYFANWGLRAVFRIILRAEISGLENVPSTSPLVVAISHSSFLDPLMTGTYMPRDVIPMAKIEAFSLPVIGPIVRWYGAFPVRRGELDLGAFKTALKILRDGNAMVIAPEGHRSEGGALQRGREGAIILSLRSGAPILPVAVWGGKPLWKNLARLHRTDMKFHVGEPVVPKRDGKPTREQIGAMSDELMLRIAALMPHDLQGYYADWTRPVAGLLQPYHEAESDQMPNRKEVEHVE
jgi:1-acyl-sn-glycerol-3-phosphate acyltransferase